MERLTQRQLTAKDWNELLGISHGQKLEDALLPYTAGPLTLKPAIPDLDERVKVAWAGIGVTYNEHCVVSKSAFDEAIMQATQPLPLPLRLSCGSNWNLNALYSHDWFSKYVDYSQGLWTLYHYLGPSYDWKSEEERLKAPTVRAQIEIQRHLSSSENFYTILDKTLGLDLEDHLFTQNLRSYMTVGSGDKRTFPLQNDFVSCLRQYLTYMVAKMPEEEAKRKNFIDLYLAGNIPVGILHQGKEYQNKKSALTLVA